MDNVTGGGRPYLKQLNKRERQWTPWDSTRAPRMALVWRAMFDLAESGEWFGIDDVFEIVDQRIMNRESFSAILRHAWKLNLVQKHATRRGSPLYRGLAGRHNAVDWHLGTGVRSASDLRRRA